MDFPNKKETVKKVQKFLKLVEDGDDGPKTWGCIIKSLNIPEEIVPETKPVGISGISKASFDLIVEYEVGGGEGYYNKFLSRPTWPQGASGVTIGIGYDLGYNTSEQFKKDWGDKLDSSSYERLSKTLGKTGGNAAPLVSSLRDISVPWASALIVFQQNTLPRFISQTLQAFPNSDKLDPDAFGALVSIVFNRGPSVTGDSRREMMNIKTLVPSKDYKAIAQEVKNMKRLWVNKGLDGLLKRRDDEAKLIAKCAGQ